MISQPRSTKYLKKASKTKEKKETNLEERETTEEIKLKENKVKPTFNNILRKMNENTISIKQEWNAV